MHNLKYCSKVTDIGILMGGYWGCNHWKNPCYVKVCVTGIQRKKLHNTLHETALNTPLITDMYHVLEYIKNTEVYRMYLVKLNKC